MTDQSGRRWDDDMERAWSGFRARLADRLTVQAEDEPLIVALPDQDVTGADLAGSAPYCQVMPYGGDRLRVEAVSNAFLDARHHLDEAQEARLCEAGFEPPQDDSPHFWLDLERRGADRAAHAIVEALRWVYGVLHPVYLAADGLEPDVVEGAVDADGAASGIDGVDGVDGVDPAAGHALPEVVGDGPWTPHGVDEVRAMLLRAATDLVQGHDPVVDDDGDLSIAAGDCVLWATPAVATPRILLWAVLAVDVTDEHRAVHEANLLNRREFGLTFMVHGDRVTVRRELPVTVFVVDDVRQEMERILGDLERWSAELVARVGGRAPHDDGPVQVPPDQRRAGAADAGGERLAAAIAVLRELEKEDRSGLVPSLLLDVFHGDRALLMGAIGETVEREADAKRRARRAEADDRPRLVRSHRARARYERDLRRRLRHALRLAVERPRKDHQEQLALFDEDEVTR